MHNNRKSFTKIIYLLIFLFVALYPLRWAFTGMDLWDIGYSCGNFVNFNTVSISRPWFYSTYLSLLTGHLLSLLPYGDTLAGIRVLCGLVISASVIVSGLFLIKRLRMPVHFVLLGEFLAVSICYSPTVILYNHMTFLFLILVIVLIYTGLTDDRDTFLFVAGIILALNVFVRISNLPQMLLILAVWYYLFLSKSSPGIYIRKTLICLAGYLSALLAGIFFFSVRYGFSEYISGIRGMLGISGEAGDYSAGSMIKELVLAYLHGGSRIFYTVLFSLAACLIYKGLSAVLKKEGTDNDNRGIALFAGTISAVCLIVFMFVKNLIIFDFYHYATVYYTVAMFIDIAVILILFTMADKNTGKDRKLISVLILLQITVLSIGSGTGISPVMNSAFLTGPFIITGLYDIYCRLVQNTDREQDGKKQEKRIYIRLAAGIALTVFSVLLIQCVAFGALYEYEEARNGAGGKFRVEGSRVLKGVKTTKERAEWIQGISEYISSSGLKGSDCIIYGYAPALAFYLELKPAITTWPDLDSYKLIQMEEDMARISAAVDKGDSRRPVIILDIFQLDEQIGHNGEKWEIIEAFIEKYNYKVYYENDRFEVLCSRR